MVKLLDKFGSVMRGPDVAFTDSISEARVGFGHHALNIRPAGVDDVTFACRSRKASLRKLSSNKRRRVVGYSRHSDSFRGCFASSTMADLSAVGNGGGQGRSTRKAGAA